MQVTSILPVRASRAARTVHAAVMSAILCTSAVRADAQASAARDTAGRAASQRRGYPPGIQDNSFLIEEAYNQDPGVVQHISQFQRDLRMNAFTYQFTQEWPVGGITHQLSYSIPVVRADAAVGVGIGDIRLNYRYQLIGDSEAWFAVAPRLTLVLPTGDAQRLRGTGATGYEVWLPASLVHSDQLIVHGNLGLTFTPRARNADGNRATTNTWTVGGSAVWLTRPYFNLFVEALYQRVEDVTGPRQTARSNEVTISPGVRWAYNVSSGLQIVPGIAVPLGIGPSAGERSVLFYLSFEHPFTKAAREQTQGK